MSNTELDFGWVCEFSPDLICSSTMSTAVWQLIMDTENLIGVGLLIFGMILPTIIFRHLQSHQACGDVLRNSKDDEIPIHSRHKVPDLLPLAVDIAEEDDDNQMFESRPVQEQQLWSEGCNWGRIIDLFFYKSSRHSLVETCTHVKNLSDDQDCVDGPNKCEICLSDVKCNERVRQLKCGHELHVACVDEWLVNMEKDTCPRCMRVVIDHSAVE